MQLEIGGNTREGNGRPCNDGKQEGAPWWKLVAVWGVVDLHRTNPWLVLEAVLRRQLAASSSGAAGDIAGFERHQGSASRPAQRARFCRVKYGRLPASQFVVTGRESAGHRVTIQHL